MEPSRLKAKQDERTKIIYFSDGQNPTLPCHWSEPFPAFWRLQRSLQSCQHPSFRLWNRKPPKTPKPNSILDPGARIPIKGERQNPETYFASIYVLGGRSIEMHAPLPQKKPQKCCWLQALKLQAPHLKHVQPTTSLSGTVRSFLVPCITLGSLIL